MARKETPDLMGELLTGKPVSSQEAPVKDMQDESLQIFTLRLPRSLKENLKSHFKRKGLKLSQGLRMIISEYMDREKLI